MSNVKSNKKLSLIDSSEGEEDDEKFDHKSQQNKGFKLTINKNYAERYDNWRNKEELQKLKDKYGDVDNLDSDDESSDETEDEDARELTQDVEKEFFKALSMVKSKDKKIYDKEKCKFFEQTANQNPAKQASESVDKKPFFMKDLEREIILKKVKKAENGLDDAADSDYNSDDDAKLKAKNKMNDKSYYEEQEEIKKSLKEAIKKQDDDEDDESGFLNLKTKSKEEREKEEADYIEWLKGRKESIDDPDAKKNMKYLHDYWNDPNLTENEKFLRDYILNKRYLDKAEEDESDESDENESVKDQDNNKGKLAGDEKLKQIDFVEFSEEENIIENQEEFERKYNFRFEEPDPEFIKSYPRTVADTMRRKDSKRKEKRDEYKKRKELEKQKKKEEIKRLKSLKKKEIMQKIDKIKKVTGTESLKLSFEDLEGDFDPEAYEKKMQSLFDDSYYNQNDPNIKSDGEDDKPVFTDDDEEDLKYENWDEWNPKNNKKDAKSKQEKKKKNKKRKNDEDEDDKEADFEMDCDLIESNVDASKKLSKFSQALLSKKPLYDPNDQKSFEEYLEEYYKLDCEDVIGGDLPCRFKYREVVPNDYGLGVEEILTCKDTELNQWASLKKAVQYRPIQNEIEEVKQFKMKKDQIELKKKILHSLFKEEEENEDDDDADENKEEDKKVEVKEASGAKIDKNANGIEANDVSNVKNKSHKIKNKKDKSKGKKNKNVMESMTNERLLAYGIDPKKFRKKIKYSNGKTSNTENAK